MAEKYEAHAYIKIKDEEGKEKTEEKIETTKRFLSMLGRLLFEKALREVYDEGIEAGFPSTMFMLRLTDFFISSVSSYFMSKNSEEEIIKEVEDLLEAVKHDAAESIRQAFKVKEELKY
jgi:hypothetical protein